MRRRTAPAPPRAEDAAAGAGCLIALGAGVVVAGGVGLLVRLVWWGIAR